MSNQNETKMAIINGGDFAWADVTEGAREIFSSGAVELYAVYSDSENLIETREDLDRALENGTPVCVEAGFIEDPQFSDPRPHGLVLLERAINEIPDEHSEVLKREYDKLLDECSTGSSLEKYKYNVEVNTVYLLNDQPTTCPQCGCRTEFKSLPNGQEEHSCRGCGFEFIGEFDEEFDGE